MRSHDALILGCLLVSLSACSSSVTDGGPATALASTVADSQRIVSITMTPESVEVRTTDTENLTISTVFSVPEWGPDDTFHKQDGGQYPPMTLQSMDAADFDTTWFLARVDDLASICTADWTVYFQAVTDAAGRTLTECGNESRWYVGDIEMTAVEDPWSAEGFRTLWAELEEASPDGQVTSIVMNSTDFVASFPQSDVVGPVQWQRPLSTGALLSTVVSSAETTTPFPLSAVKPTAVWDRLSSAAHREGVDLHDGAGFKITADEDTITIALVSATRSEPITIEIDR